MLTDLSIKDFLKATASGSAVPGGGSIAALNGASSASLCAMVANLTIGKKGYEAVEAEMQSIAKTASDLKQQFIQNIDRDAEAYHSVLQAFKRPRGTDAEKQIRNETIQAVFKQAAQVPLQVAEAACNLFELIEKVVTQGNKNAVTDGAVAALTAGTAVQAALYNVQVNLGSIKDQVFVDKTSARVKAIQTQVEKAEKEILAKVNLNQE